MSPCRLCQSPAQAKGLCEKHYRRQLRGKDPFVDPSDIKMEPVAFRVPVGTMATIKPLAAELRMTPSQWFRMAILNQLVRSRSLPKIKLPSSVSPK